MEQSKRKMQSLHAYGAEVVFEEVSGFEVEVWWVGGLWPDESERKRFPNMAEALAAVTGIFADLEEEEAA